MIGTAKDTAELWNSLRKIWISWVLFNWMAFKISHSERKTVDLWWKISSIHKGYTYVYTYASQTYIFFIINGEKEVIRQMTIQTKYLT